MLPTKNIIRTKVYPITPEFLASDLAQGHRRLETFAHKGTQCCVPGCHRVGTHVVHWYSAGDFKKYGDSGLGLHIDIVGYEADGKEYLMTVDHALPRSLGGSDHIDNKNPMCAHHNSRKGNKNVKVPAL